MIVLKHVNDLEKVLDSFEKDILRHIIKNAALTRSIVDTPLCILTSSDDVYDLPSINLGKEKNGIYNEQLICGKMDSVWELVNAHTVDGNECSATGKTVWELVIMLSDDYIVTILIPDEPWLNKDLKAALVNFK
jgi:hypothetical protein